jgi:hypothetical protein
MTDKLRSEREVDAAIDRAVREIMSVEPRPGFRRRVLERLTGAPPARRTWARVTVGMTAAAAATLIAALWFSTPERSTAPTTPTLARQQPAEVAPGPPPSPKTEPKEPAVNKPIRPPRARPTPRTQVPQPPPGRVEAASLPLVQPQPGVEGQAQSNAANTIEAVRVSPLRSIPEVDVRSRIIERITIPPLSPPR